MLHREHQFGNRFPGMRANDCCTQDFVAALFSQDFDKACGLAFGNGAVKIVEGIFGDVISQPLHIGLRLRHANACNLGIGIGDARQHAVIRSVFFEGRGKRVDAGVPCFMTCAVGQLLTSGNIACG